MARTVKDYSQITMGDIWGDFTGNAAYELDKFFEPLIQSAEAVSQWGCLGAEGVGQWFEDAGQAVKDGAVAVKEGAEDALDFGGAVLNGVGNVAKDGADAAWKAFAGAGRSVADSFNEGFSEARKAPKRDGLPLPSSSGTGRNGPELDCP